MVETIFSWAIYSDIIFPFLLVFTLLFTLLEKLKILGENKQNHALISLAVAMILIATPAREVIRNIVPYFAICAVILLIFMLLYGFVLQKNENMIEGNLKLLFLIAILGSLVVAILGATGYWGKFLEFLRTESSFVINLIMLASIGAGIYVIVKYSGGGKTDK